MSGTLSVQGLVKEFGPIRAVDDISFEVAPGEVLGFLGPNGAGKSTTMKMVTGFLPPTAGTAEVCGFDVTQDPIEVKRRIGYLPEGAPLYEDMTPIALLRFVAGVRGMATADRDRAIDEAAEKINIGHVMYQPIGTLSKGFKRRVGLAQAILHDPDVLILDEPTDGLDPNQKHEVRELIQAMSADKAIIISTHILEEVDAVCSRAIVIASGKLVADATPAELIARAPEHNVVSVRVRKEFAEDARTKLGGLDVVSEIVVQDGSGDVHELHARPVNGAAIIQPVSECIQSSGIAVEEMRVLRGHLDDVFRQITATGGQEAGK